MDITTTQGMKQALTDKLRLGFGVTPEEADDAQVMRAAALVLRDVMTERGVESRMATRREEKRKVHYLSMEFLLGRSLEKNAYNLGVSGVLREAIGELGFRAADILFRLMQYEKRRSPWLLSNTIPISRNCSP